MSAKIDWSGSSGDVWSRRWPETDRGLAPVGSALNAEILRNLPDRSFRALDVGCGPGTTALAIAGARPDGNVIGCDLSSSLIAVAKERGARASNVEFFSEDAEQAARGRGAFDLIFSRHGVMFFDDPVRAFRTLREAVAAGGRLVFSCFRDWSLNRWAAEPQAAVVGREVEPPGRESGAFAFAEAVYVRDLLGRAGWSDIEAQAVDYDYVAGAGVDAAGEALAFLSELGPASRLLQELPEEERPVALDRLREIIERHHHDDRIDFPAAAWVWTACAS